MGNTSVGNLEEGSITQDLADVSLKDDPRLPCEVLGNIVGFLVADGALKTAGHFNQTCRAVYEETLPILYETMVVYNAETFAKCLGETDNKSWKHFKYLFVAMETSALILQYIDRTRQLAPCTGNCAHLHDEVTFRHAVPRSVRIIANHIGRCHQQGRADYYAESDAAFCQAFPRLVFFASVNTAIPQHTDPSIATDPSKPVATVHLSVSRPVSLDVILDRLSNDGSSFGVAFFGIRFATGDGRSQESAARVYNVESVEFKEEGSITPLIAGREIEMQSDALSVVDVGSWRKYEVLAQGEDANPRLAAGLGLIMDCATFNPGNAGNRNRHVELTLRRASLEIVTRVITARASSTVPSLHIQLDPRFSIRRYEMQQYLEQLANAYASGWTHHPSRHGEEFLKVKTETSVPAEGLKYPAAKGMMEIAFTYGHDSGTSAVQFAGFTTSLLAGYEYSSSHGHHRHYGGDHPRHYPCPHVPFVLPRSIQVREEPRPLFTHVMHIGGDGRNEIQLAPGLQVLNEPGDRGDLRVTDGRMAIRFIGVSPQ